MDGRKFDALTKRLAGGVSRRRAIKGLLGVGGAAASHADAAAADLSWQPDSVWNRLLLPGRQ
jgi:hypothetical protein